MPILIDASFADIRLFVAVCEERSFTKAALREGATQSGVSQHIRKLEARFGIPLVRRQSGTVVPTPAGEAYYRRCLEVLRNYELANQDVRRFVGGTSGEISVGLMPTMTRSVLSPALARFTADHPNVAVHIVEAYSAVLSEQVAAGELDFAIVPASQDRAGIRTNVVQRTPEILVSGPRSEREHLKPVRLRDIGPLKVVLPGNANARRSTLERYFQANEVKVFRQLELDTMFATIDFVESTDWVTILPGVMMVSDIDRDRLKLNPLSDPPLWLDLAQIVPLRRALSSAAALFFSVLMQETERLNSRWNSLLATKRDEKRPMSGRKAPKRKS
jgi:LysR family nitrogen assimilation transcriptional regulator